MSENWLIPGLFAFTAISLSQIMNVVKSKNRKERILNAKKNALNMIDGISLSKGYSKTPLMGYLTASEMEIAVKEVRKLHPNATDSHLGQPGYGLQFSSIDSVEPTKQELCEENYRIPRLAKVTSMHKI